MPLAQDVREVTVGLVLEQAGVEPVSSISEKILDLLALLDGQQASCLQLDKGSRDHQEPCRRLEVDGVQAVTQGPEVVSGDVGEVDLRDLDLTSGSQVEQKVEGALEHVELHLVRHQGLLGAAGRGAAFV